MDYMKLTKNELLQKCEELGITKCKSKNKSELVELILNKSNANNANEQSVPTEENIVPEEKPVASTETKSTRKTATKKVKEVVLPKAVEDTFQETTEESKPAEVHVSEPVKPKRKPAVKKSEVVSSKPEEEPKDIPDVATESYVSETANPANKPTAERIKVLATDSFEENLANNNEVEVPPKVTVRSRAKTAAKKVDTVVAEEQHADAHISEESVEVKVPPAPVAEKPKRKPAVKKSATVAETKTIEHTDESSVNDEMSSVDAEHVPVKKAVVKKRKEVDINVNMTAEDFKDLVKDKTPLTLSQLVYNKTYYVDNEGETSEPRNIVFGRFVGLENAEDEDGNSLVIAHFKNVHKVMGEYKEIGELEFIVEYKYLAYVF